MWTDAPLFPDSASSVSGQVDLLYFFIWAVAILFTGLVSMLVLLFVVRYRKRDGHASHQIEGSLKLEIFWSVVPLVVGLIIFFWSAKLYFETSTPPGNSMDVSVTGKQWMWRLQHPQGQREINELHVPLGEPVRLTMISEDVIHSFYVPAFRMKMDVLPGKYTTAWFQATKAGEYHLFCAEYCGTKHSEMVGTIYVMEPDDYEAWLLGNTGENLTTEEAGAKLFEELRCATCHPSEIAEVD
ncbi:MAG: cytochrome c oxidase subunit II, partial [Planctomycetota bacterium]